MPSTELEPRPLSLAAPNPGSVTWSAPEDSEWPLAVHPPPLPEKGGAGRIVVVLARPAPPQAISQLSAQSITMGNKECTIG